MTRRICSTRTLAAGALLALAGPGLAACDGDETEQDYRYQCAIDVNGQPQAVDCDDVDDDGGFVYVGGYSHPVFIYSYPASQTAAAVGQKMPHGGHRIGYTDTAGRQRVGLPASGRVANNTVKTNVVGKGGAPGAVGARGGSGGG